MSDEFDPSRPFSVIKKSEEFDPSKPFKVLKQSGPSQLESGLRGAAQGASLGFADEVTGGLEAAKDLILDPSTGISDLPARYSQHRNESRANYLSSEKANPGTYLTGNVVGGAATMLVPGLNAAKAATMAGRVGAGALAGGRVGAIGGFGASEGSDVSEIIRDTGKGAAVGAAMGGATPVVMDKVIAPAIKSSMQKGSQLLQKAVRGVTDTSEEMVNRAQAAGGSAAIKNAPTASENTQNLLEKIKNLKNRVSEGSGASREILEAENVIIPKDKIHGAIDSEIASIKSSGVFTDDVERTLGRLEKLKGRVDGDLSGNSAKSLLQQLDDYAYKGTQGAAEFGKQDTNSFKSLRRAIDQDLKTQSPAYKTQMESVAADAALNAQAKSAGRNPQATVKNLLGNSPSDKSAEVARGLGLTDDIEASKLNKYFSSGTTNGSRKTMAGGAIGGAVGWLLGPLGSALGSGAGSVAGAALDKNGRVLALKASELASRLEPKALALGKYSKTLAEAAARGPGALLITHQMLAKDPAYVQILKESE